MAPHNKTDAQLEARVLELAEEDLSNLAIARMTGLGEATVRRIRQRAKDPGPVKRILAVGDLHCGHKAGLTPPDWWSGRDPWRSRQQEMWELYLKGLELCGDITCVLGGGDFLDGKGEKSGGSELITTDRLEQAQMAVACLDEIKTQRFVLVRGTPYHTGKSEDFEDVVATELRERMYSATIGNHEWVDVDGAIFDIRHHVGGSSTPYSRSTAISKTRLWNLLWAERENQPKANVFLRWHVHSFNRAGGRDWQAYTCPALQGMGSKFGELRCEGTVDWGMLWFDVDQSGHVTMHEYMPLLHAAKVQVMVV